MESHTPNRKVKFIPLAVIFGGIATILFLAIKMNSESGKGDVEFRESVIEGLRKLKEEEPFEWIVESSVLLYSNKQAWADGDAKALEAGYTKAGQRYHQAREILTNAIGQPLEVREEDGSYSCSWKLPDLDFDLVWLHKVRDLPTVVYMTEMTELD
jgi:hypothetical protein